MRRGRVPELGLLLLGYQLFQTIGLSNLPPVTLLTIMLQVAVYLQMVVVPRICLSADAIWMNGEYLRLLVPVIRHLHDIHLYYNMISFAWKGISLERRFGSLKFFFTLVALTILSSGCTVLVALALSDLLEDPSYSSQCAVGFSGVLFALKVLTTHYDHHPTEQSAFFGILLPVRYAVWAELVLIQLLVPNASFVGHLGGIIAGLLFVKGPFGGFLSVVPRSPLSLLPTNFTSWFVTCGLVGLYTGSFSRKWKMMGCINTRDLMASAWRSFGFDSFSTLLQIPLYHQSLLHLLLGLLSFHVKSWQLEARMGHVKYFLTIISVYLATIGVEFVLYRQLVELAASRSGIADLLPPGQCAVGLSGPLFGLKVLLLLAPSRYNSAILFEIMELIVLMEKNTRLYHVSGLLAGIIVWIWSDNNRYPGTGRMLGGDHGAGDYPGRGRTYTRSWGYGPRSADPSYGPIDDSNEGMDMSGASGTNTEYTDDDASLQEALNRSRESYMYEEAARYQSPQQMPPSAPPEETIASDYVRQRPPLYPPGGYAGPPPAAKGWAIRSFTSSPSSSDASFHGGYPHAHDNSDLPDGDELRMRRMQRFA